MGTLRRRAKGLAGTFLAITVTLVACSSPNDEDVGEQASAESTAPRCSSHWLRDKCTVKTPYVAAPKGVRPLNGTAPPGAGCNEFSCSDFAGNWCRCAESYCPGITGKMLYQQIVKCTYYYNCDHLSVNHAMDIICDPVPGDPTKKHCKCIEPNRWGQQYNTVYGEGDIGINDNPPAEWCQDVVCNKFLGPKGWRGCGGETKTTCDNVNGRDRCPKDCCIKQDGTMADYCFQCDRNQVPLCEGVKLPVAVAVPIQ